jgi:L-iditol 2-dehydrogenase
MWAQTILAPYTCGPVRADAPRTSDLEPGQVILRVLAGGICGSDLPAFRDGSLMTMPHPPAPVPGYPLHEVAGEVVASRDELLAVGARVVGWASGRNAAAELIVADGSGLYAYDEALSPTEAIVMQPLACVLSAVREQPYEIAGLSAAVLGLGPIGILFAHVLRSMGVSSVTGVDRVDRSDVAARFGIDEVVTMSGTRWVAGLTPTSPRPQFVVEAVGHQVGTLTDAVRAVADRGRVLYFGIPDDEFYPFPMVAFLRKNATFSAGYTRDKRSALADAARYLKEHADLPSAYITSIFPMSELQAAFELADRPAKGRLKIVLSAP